MMLDTGESRSVCPMVTSFDVVEALDKPQDRRLSV